MSDVRATIAAGTTWQAVAADRQRHRDATVQAALQLQEDMELPPTPPMDGTAGDKDGLPQQLPLDAASLLLNTGSGLTEAELAITRSNVEDLAPRLASGSLTATEVVTAFLRRAALAEKRLGVHCVAELLPERALRRAAELDARLAAPGGGPVGPLHGVPISVKEHIAMRGLDLNAGFVAWVGRVGDDDAQVLKILWDAGAVFYARTTQPQTLMHLETSSNLYG